MAASSNPVEPVPGQPGTYINTATGEVFKLVEFRDDDVYDTEDLASGTQAAGTRIEFFVNMTDKKELDTNLDTPRRLPRGSTMVIQRIGVDIPLVVGNTLTSVNDVKKIAYGSYLRVEINRIVIAEGPTYKFGSGYGLVGSTTENNASIVSIGVASTAAKRDLAKQHFITDDHSLYGKAEFLARDWDTDATTQPNLAAVCHMRLQLGGRLSQAATK